MANFFEEEFKGLLKEIEYIPRKTVYTLRGTSVSMEWAKNHNLPFRLKSGGRVFYPEDIRIDKPITNNPSESTLRFTEEQFSKAKELEKRVEEIKKETNFTLPTTGWLPSLLDILKQAGDGSNPVEHQFYKKPADIDNAIRYAEGQVAGLEIGASYEKKNKKPEENKMKVTKTQLEQIIKEEYEKVINEMDMMKTTPVLNMLRSDGIDLITADAETIKIVQHLMKQYGAENFGLVDGKLKKTDNPMVMNPKVSGGRAASTLSDRERMTRKGGIGE